MERRRIESEVRAEKTRLRLSQSSTQGKTAESNIVENLADENLDVEDQGNKSLEWDHSADAPPSFSNQTWDSNQTVEELIQDILDKTSEDSDTEKENPLGITKAKSRRKTSTDNAFLDVAVDPLHQFLWPPRLPSQEPEFNPLLHSSLTRDPRCIVEILSEDEEEEESISVFDESGESSPSDVDQNMDETIYKERLRVVKVEARKVRYKVSTFLPDSITNVDLSTYVERLASIREQVEQCDEVVVNLVLDLEEQDPNDARITQIENDQATLKREVSDNEQKVKVKIEELLASKPITRAEQEALDLKKTKLELEKKKDEREKKKETDQKALKTQKAKIDIALLTKRATDLSKSIEEIDEASNL